MFKSFIGLGGISSPYLYKTVHCMTKVCKGVAERYWCNSIAKKLTHEVIHMFPQLIMGMAFDRRFV